MDRALILGRLEAERRQAEGCFEHQRAAELQAQIDQISAAGSSVPPVKETTRRRRPAAPSRRTE